MTAVSGDDSYPTSPQAFSDQSSEAPDVYDVGDGHVTVFSEESVGLTASQAAARIRELALESKNKKSSSQGVDIAELMNATAHLILALAVEVPSAVAVAESLQKLGARLKSVGRNNKKCNALTEQLQQESLLLAEYEVLVPEDDVTRIGMASYRQQMDEALVQLEGVLNDANKLIHKVAGGNVLKKLVASSSGSKFANLETKLNEAVARVCGHFQALFDNSIESASHMGAAKSSESLGQMAASLAVRNASLRLPPSPDCVMGRDEEIAEVRELLASHGTVVVTGGAGEGKTTVIVKAARDMLEAGQLPGGTYYINCRGRELLDHEPGTTLPNLPLAHLISEELVGQGMCKSWTAAKPIWSTIERQLRQMHQENQAVLLLFDNANEFVDDEQSSFSLMVEALARLGARVLIASRLSMQVAIAQTVPLSPLDTEGAIGLVRARVVGARRLNAASATHLAASCSSNSLLLTVASGLINGGVASLDELVKHGRDAELEVEGEEEEDTGVDRLHIQQLRDWMKAHVTSSQRHALERLSVFMSGFDMYGATMMLSELPKVASVLRGLWAVSLLQGEVSGRLSMHSMVREVAAGWRALLPPPTQHRITKDFVVWAERVSDRVMNGVDPMVSLDASSIILVEGANLRHAASMVDQRNHARDYKPMVACIHKVGQMLHTRHFLDSAALVHRQVLAARTRVQGEAHPDTLSNHNDLALVMFNMEQLPQAAAMHQAVWEHRVKSLGKRHPDTLGSRANLARVKVALGELQDAADMHKQVLDARVKVLGPEHPFTLGSRNALAVVTRDLGLFKEAAALHRQVLEVQVRVLGDEHQDTWASRSSIAALSHIMGDQEEAIEIYEQVLEEQTRVMGEQHQHTLSTHNNLAIVLQDSGRLEEAAEMHREVLEIQRRTQGDEHQLTLRSRNNLVVVLCAMGRLEEAAEMHKQVLAIRRRALGEAHPDTLSSRSNLAIVLRDLGELQEAADMHRRVLDLRTWVLGQEHPDTLSTKRNLALVMGDQGLLQEASVIHKEVLQVSRRVLGDAHPDTALARQALTECMVRLGDGENND